MATFTACVVVVLVFGLLTCSSHQSPVLRHDEPEDQSLTVEGEEEESSNAERGDGSDVAELLEPDLATLCFAQRPDNVCFGSYLNSPHQTWSSGRGCLADSGKSCDTIVVMDTYLFPSHIKYTIFLPAVHDHGGDSRQQEASLYRLFLTPPSNGQNDWSYADRIAKDNGIDETGEGLETEFQYFEIFKNSTGMAISRSLVDGESEEKAGGFHPNHETDDEKVTGGGFLFPSPEEEGNGELVHDPTTGKFFERYTTYSGSLILIGRMRRPHENGSAPLFLDLERNDVVLHLERLAVPEKGGFDQLDEGGEKRIEQVIQSPILRLMSRGQDTTDGSHDSRPAPSLHSPSFGSMLSIKSIDIAMGVVIIALILLLIMTCNDSLKQTPESPTCANKCLQIASRSFRRQRNPGLISDFS